MKVCLVRYIGKRAKYLKDGLDKGFAQGAKAELIDIAFNSPDKLLLEELTQNIYLFSGAKTYQEVRAMSNLLLQPELKSSFISLKKRQQKYLMTTTLTICKLNTKQV